MDKAQLKWNFQPFDVALSCGSINTHKLLHVGVINRAEERRQNLESVFVEQFEFHVGVGNEQLILASLGAVHEGHRHRKGALEDPLVEGDDEPAGLFQRLHEVVLDDLLRKIKKILRWSQVKASANSPGRGPEKSAAAAVSGARSLELQAK